MDSPNIVVSRVTKPELDDPTFKSLQQQETFSPPKRPGWPWALCSLLFIVYYHSFPWGKGRRNNINYSPSPSVEVTNDCGYPSISFICSDSVKTDNFTFLLTMCGLRTQTQKILCNRMNVKIGRKNAKL